ncbi:MAG TPA: hypothetical protein VMW04_00070 [Patescibacteria group bacterium]|nr:hypothetical protein [Patescibacteria group bacterium]
MRRSKFPKTFLKTKEKLVFIPPEKFLGRRVLGVVLLIAGSLILTFSIVYFYLVPVFFPPKTEMVKVREEKPPFVPKRVLIPAFDLSYWPEEGTVEGKVTLALAQAAKGEEIFLLGEKEYLRYEIVSAEATSATAAAGLNWEEGRLKLILVSQTKPAKNISLEAIPMGD